MSAAFRIAPLAAAHDRDGFCCGSPPLDRYLRELAGQDVKRRVSNCFVAIDPAGGIAGYYTFAATSLQLTELPEDIARRLPRYAAMPAGLIGRLAVARNVQGCGLGGALVMDAALRASRSDTAIYALIVEAKDDVAAAFYERLQFRRFASRARALFLPLATALQAMEK